MKRRLVFLVSIVLATIVLASWASASPVGSAFTYQGSLDKSGVPTSATCNFRFQLFDSLASGSPVGPTLTPAVTLLENGQFSVPLDFGPGIFDGNNRWLEIAVQCPGDPGFTTLSPRQPITAAPYALYALSGVGGGSGLALPFAGAVTAPSQDAFRVQNNAAGSPNSAVHGVSVSSASGGTGAVFGEATATSGGALAVYGLATASPGGTGVVGKGGATGGWFEAMATTGDFSGLYGVTHTSTGSAGGVKGINYATTGNTTGTWGVATSSPTGTGVAGIGSATGGYFVSNATSGGDFAGVYGVANTANGVKGTSTSGIGVFGLASTNHGVQGTSTSGSGVVGSSSANDGIEGYTFTTSGTHAGVYGNSASTNLNSAGVRGEGTQASGVEGISSSGAGVFGHSSGSIGVSGSSPSSFGVLGVSGSQAGVKGISGSAPGVYGQSSAAGSAGVFGINSTGDGVSGQSSGASKSGVVGISTSASGYGGWFNNSAGGVALYANGLVQVRTMQILGADVAESFPVEGGGTEPGTVLAIAGDDHGTLCVCREAYCKRVAGVVSGANGLPAGVVLKGDAFEAPGHAAVAMSGRVWVKCDATSGPIHVGDLLTTAGRAGHAMRASDAGRGTGAILGKAMTALETGTGLVLTLVSLQ